MGLFNSIGAYSKPFYIAEVTDQEFIERRKEYMDKVFKSQNLPSVDEIARDGKFVVAFHGGIGYFQAGKDVIFFIENKVEPGKYFPKGRKNGDPIPTETIARTVAEKLGISYELFMEMSGVKEGDFTPIN